MSSHAWPHSRIEDAVEVRYTDEKGRCLYTKVALEPGDIIFVEQPLLVSLPALDEEVWSILQKVNNDMPMELPPVWHQAALCSLLQLDRVDIDICCDKWVPPDCLECSDDVLRVIKELPERCTKVLDASLYQRVLMAWRYNSFGHHSDADGLVMYNRISMMSHSCRATCCWHYGEGDTYILRARVKLDVGDELSISYIGDEDLVKSVDYRRMKLQGWLFDCMCDRCATTIDDCRGFKCSKCGAGVCFVQQPTGDEALPSAPCTRCFARMSASTIEQRIHLEQQYVARLEQIEKGDLADLELVYSEAANIFEQHWIIYTLQTQMAEVYRERQMYQEAFTYQMTRIKYHEAVLPWVTYTLAWCYEELGDIQSQTVDNISKASIVTRNVIASYYERAYFMMVLLCGEQHNYTISAQQKWWTVLNCGLENEDGKVETYTA